MWGAAGWGGVGWLSRGIEGSQESRHVWSLPCFFFFFFFCFKAVIFWGHQSESSPLPSSSHSCPPSLQTSTINDDHLLVGLGHRGSLLFSPVSIMLKSQINPQLLDILYQLLFILRTPRFFLSIKVTHLHVIFIYAELRNRWVWVWLQWNGAPPNTFFGFMISRS